MKQQAVLTLPLDQADGDSRIGADQACALLRAEVLSCNLMPGSAITEADLIERYQLGRATCRVALQRLMQEGLVRSVPRQGYVITPITLKDVEEVFAMRAQLEPMAARLAAGRVDIAKLQELERICRLDNSAMGIKRQTGVFMDANTAFHMEIAESSGNARLARALQGLLNEMARLVALGFGVQGAKPEIKHDHNALIEALQQNDGKRAEQIARRHIQTFHEMTMEKVIASLSEADSAVIVGRQQTK